MLHPDGKVKKQRKQLLELEAELTDSRGKVVRLHPQMASTKCVRDIALGYMYGAGVTRMHTHFLAILELT